MKNSHQTQTILLHNLNSKTYGANIITSEDLEQFKWELLDNIKEYLDKREGKKTPSTEEKVWINSLRSFAPFGLQKEKKGKTN